MDKLTLADVMQSQTVTSKNDGFRITNAAGSADYDADGQRTHVNGVPEYFPLKLEIEVKPKSETRWMIVKDGETRITDAKGNTLCRFGYLGDKDEHEPHKDIDRVAEEILRNANSNEQDMKQLRAGGAVNSNKKWVMGEAPLEDGQVFIKDAVIQPSAITSASMDYHAFALRRAIDDAINAACNPGGIIAMAIRRDRGAGNW